MTKKQRRELEAIVRKIKKAARTYLKHKEHDADWYAGGAVSLEGCARLLDRFMERRNK